MVCKCKVDCYVRGVRCRTGQRYDFDKDFLPKEARKFFEFTTKERLIEEDENADKRSKERDLGIKEIDDKKVKPKMSPEDEKLFEKLT